MAVDAGENTQVLVGVDWQRLFPWLILARSFKVAASATVLFVATVGAIVTPVGWRLLEVIGVEDVEAAEERSQGTHPANSTESASSPRVSPRSMRLGTDWGRFPWEELDSHVSPVQLPAIVIEGPSQMTRMPARMLGPWSHVVLERSSWKTLTYHTLGLLWTLLVWGGCGGIITRMALVRLGRGERVGLVETVRYVLQRPAYFLSPLLPQIAFVLAAISGLIAGLLMRVGVGVLLMALLWPLVICLGILGAVIALGTALGWPMMWAVPGAEPNGDIFEATQRSFSYAWERPLRYGFYVLVAFVLGCLGWIVVRWFSQAVIHFSLWTVAWGASWDRVDEVARSDSGVASVGWAIIAGWHALVRSVAVGFTYSYFWVAFSGIYLLLRHDVDEHVPLDRIHMPDETDRYGLPPLTRDEWGVPGVAKDEEAGAGVAAPSEGEGSDVSTPPAQETPAPTEQAEESAKDTEPGEEDSK